MEKYEISPTELFTVKIILLAKEENYQDLLLKYVTCLKGRFRSILESLQSKGLILKTYNIPKPGSSFIPEDVEFNKNFIKQFFKASYKMGEELFETYPQFITINGVSYNARRVSKKFDSLEDAFAKYGKNIHYNPELHQQIIDDVKWGIENGYNFTTLDDFIVDRSYTALNAYRNGNGINVNTEAIKMV